MAGPEKVKEYEFAFVAKLLESENVKRGLEDISKCVKNAGHKAKGFFDDIRKFIPDLGIFNKLLGMAGVGGVVSFGALVSMMPQASRAFARVKQSVRQLAQFLGSVLEPAFNGIEKAIGYVVQKVMDFETKTGIFGSMATAVNDVVDKFIKWDEETGFIEGLITGVANLAKKFTEWVADGGLQKVLGFVGGIWTAVDNLAKTGSVALGIDYDKPESKVIWAMAGALALAGHPILGVGLLAAYGLYETVSASEKEGYKSFLMPGGGEIGSQRQSGKDIAQGNQIIANSIFGEDLKRAIESGSIWDTLVNLHPLNFAAKFAVGTGYMAKGGIERVGEDITGWGPKEDQLQDYGKYVNPEYEKAAKESHVKITVADGRELSVSVDGKIMKDTRTAGGGTGGF